MTTPRYTDKDLLDYLAGDGTPGERQAVETWAAERVERQALLEQFREIQVAAASRARPEFDVPAMIRTVDTYCRTSSMPASPAIPARTARWMRWAAVSVAVVFAFVVQMVWRHTDDAAHSELTSQQYRTTSGQRAVLTLADGSVVQLAPQTTMTVPRGFQERHRDIHLDGRAYFEVVQEQSPFVVHAADVAVRVLGTAFDVASYSHSKDVQVAVERGRVVLGGDALTSAVTLSAGMMARVTDSAAQVWRSDDVPQYTAWVSGNLIFRNTPAREVLKSLERWFGLEFRLTDSTLANDRLTVRVSTESSAAALATLAQNLNVSISRHDTVITLRPRRGASLPQNENRERRVPESPFLHEVGR